MKKAESDSGNRSYGTIWTDLEYQHRNQDEHINSEGDARVHEDICRAVRRRHCVGGARQLILVSGDGAPPVQKLGGGAAGAQL